MKSDKSERGEGRQRAAARRSSPSYGRPLIPLSSFINVQFVLQSVSFYSSVTWFLFHSIRPSLCTLLCTVFILHPFAVTH